ncbi:MAG: UDP-N-acetylmuramate dehydrogenase [Simkaniaceae bacterium]|nr:UDP-N-acetylmuramate dehydrogenase [Candidatus Sacchlamyda saccharinae]
MKPFLKNRSLSKFSTFGIGGNARYFIEVHTIEELQDALKQADGLPFHILGKGSNSLFSDEGFDGLVIHNKINFCEIERNEVSVGAGFSFSHLGVKTARKGLAGLEFASGIPASVGGAVFMNAGANGQETCDCLKEVTFVDLQGNIKIYSDLIFSYRTSPFQKMRGAIAAAKFVLQPEESARKKQLDIVAYRSKTQPYDALSCGCIFRNPEGESAGALIERCGLKEMQMGGARVSELHANFIVNADGATAKDVLSLAEYIKQVVKEKTNIELEMELREI